MLRFTCTVTRGKIYRVADVERLDHTEIVVAVAKVLRRSVVSSHGADVAGPGVVSTPHSRRKDLTRIYTPLKCKVKAGRGEYVISARVRLGQPRLTCASTIAEWVRLVRNANADGRAPCVLDT